MKPLNITLPPDVAAMIADGSRRTITHNLNPRISRYFAAKRPTEAIVNKTHLVRIKTIELTESTVILHI